MKPIWGSHLIGHTYPLIGSLRRTRTGVILDEMSRSEQFNLVEWEHRTGNCEKDSVETDLDVDVDVGEILGRDDDPVSSASSRNAGKTVFWVFLTMHYLKSPICFLISISRKLKSPSRILHCRKQLMSEEKWGKLKVPRFSGKTGGIHTFSKFRWLFTYHNSPGKANELQNEITLKEKRYHKGLWQQP